MTLLNTIRFEVAFVLIRFCVINFYNFIAISVAVG